MIKSFPELIRLRTFEERFEYLRLGGVVGRSTFGFERYLNQVLYHSREWKIVRRNVIIRDASCDLGISDRIIFNNLLIHHINPITIDDIENSNAIMFDMNNLICTSLNTHNAIHYGDASLLINLPKERSKGDTRLWKAY